MEQENKGMLFDEAIESSKRAIENAPSIKKEESVFNTLRQIDCSDFIQYRGSQTQRPYISWASAWGIVKRLYPDASYSVKRSANDTPYFTDGKTCWVEVAVAIDGIEITDIYPIYNKSFFSLPLEQVTMKEVNDAIRRALTKCIAMHGLALYLYGYEGLPEESLMDLIELVNKAQTVEAVSAIYRDAVAKNDLLNKFQQLINACAKRKNELLNTQNNRNDEDK